MHYILVFLHLPAFRNPQGGPCNTHRKVVALNAAKPADEHLNGIADVRRDLIEINCCKHLVFQPQGKIWSQFQWDSVT